MNKAIIIGRLVKDPEKRATTNGISVATFTLAVDRRFKGQDGNKQADFINCVAWRSSADFVSKYFSKGMKMSVVGNIQTRMYTDKDGINRYVTEIVTGEVDFVERKKPGNSSSERELSETESKEVDKVFGAGEGLDDFESLDDAELLF